MLRPGGVFLYDTINRTWRSKLVVIKIAQEWSSTAWAEPDTHDFAMFVHVTAVNGGELSVGERQMLAGPLAVVDRKPDLAGVRAGHLQ